MAKNIERDHQIRMNAEKNLHAEFENWSVKRLINEILKIRKEKSQLEKEYNKLIEKTELNKEIPKENYSQKWTYPQKITFILLNEQRPLTSTQIFHLLMKADGHFEDFRNPIAILNTYLGRMMRTGRIKAHKLPGIRKHFYILPEWLGADNKLQSQYLVHLNFLS